MLADFPVPDDAAEELVLRIPNGNKPNFRRFSCGRFGETVTNQRLCIVRELVNPSSAHLASPGSREYEGNADGPGIAVFGGVWWHPFAL